MRAVAFGAVQLTFRFVGHDALVFFARSGVVLALLLVFSTGCSTSRRDRDWLASELDARLDIATTLDEEDSASIALDDDAVIARVLRFNPQLRAEITRIDSARATLDEASRPTNPQLSVLGGFGPISTMASLVAPLESLWQMPLRSRVAALDVDITGEGVLLRALELVRDARIAVIDLRATIARATIRASLRDTAAELARIAAVRAQLGDNARLDERLFRADAVVAADNDDGAATEVVVARARVAAVLAVDDARIEEPPAPSARADEDLTLSTLIQLARATRPDARAAAFALEAASARHSAEVGRVFSLSGLAEGHWQQAGPSARLGARVELPIFGVNPGGLGRADAEIGRADAALDVVARVVIADVTTAYARLGQARRSRARYETEILPALDEALAVATSGFTSGDDGYLVVLDVLRRVGDARLSHVDLLADEQRARCELERAVGARLDVIGAVAARLAHEEDR